MFRFLHAADIHLDSPLVGLDRYESAPVEAMRSATRHAFENLVRVAIDEELAFVLLAGDLYDGDWKDYRTGLFFVDQMTKLREADIPVYVISGNHDAASRLTRNLRPPDNVHFLSDRRPETRYLEAFDVAIHGQGIATQAVTRDLATAYPMADPGLFNIGLLHTSLDGREGHARYAPTSPQVLAQKGYQYWALGHVHRREVVSRDPWIVFPGNLQGRHAREAGPKGCSLVTVENGAVAAVEERHVDVLRWSVCRVDVDGAGTTCEVLDRSRVRSRARPGSRTAALWRSASSWPDPRPATTSSRPIRITGSRRSAPSRPGVSSADVWIEKVRFATGRPVDLAAWATRDDAIGSFLRDFTATAGSPDETAALQDALGDVRRVLPPELLSGDEAVDPHAPELLARLVAEARELLIAQITRAEAER